MESDRHALVEVQFLMLPDLTLISPFVISAAAVIFTKLSPVRKLIYFFGFLSVLLVVAALFESKDDTSRAIFAVIGAILSLIACVALSKTQKNNILPNKNRNRP